MKHKRCFEYCVTKYLCFQKLDAKIDIRNFESRRAPSSSSLFSERDKCTRRVVAQIPFFVHIGTIFASKNTCIKNVG